MRNILTISKSPTPGQSVFLHEYQSPGFKRLDDCANDHLNYRTTLFVVFDGNTQRRFSSVRIILCYRIPGQMKINIQRSWVSSDLGECPQRMLTFHAQGVQQLGPATHISRDQAHQAPENDPALPQLTVAFHALDGGSYYDPIPPYVEDEFRCRWDSKSLRILLESKHPITPDTQSVSVPFQHSIMLGSPSNRPVCFHHNPSDFAYVTTRTVRVVANDARPRITISRLPTELLMKILEATNSCAWQHDLLSFAQVCRQWSQHSMRILFARLELFEWKNYCHSFPTQYLDPCAFARAFSETPFLGLGIEYLRVDQHNTSSNCSDHRKISPRFTPELVGILRVTKNLQRLHLSLGYSSKANALFSSFPKLDHLHTLSITQTTCKFMCSKSRSKYWEWSINVVQLAHCMARWPALTSLTVEGIAPGSIGIKRIFLRSPRCALTHFCIRHSYMSDRDLQYLTASSISTLAHVTLDHVRGITDDGLHAFLHSISRNVTSLTVMIWSISNRSRNYVLDDVVDKMRCLEALNIGGDIASELMLRRRSEMFVGSCGLGVPVVRLTFQSVPGIMNCVADEWAGWDW